jgi:hypothetical protein
MGAIGMPDFPWNTDVYWSMAKPILDRAARSRGYSDGSEAMAYIWEHLHAKYPNGIPSEQQTIDDLKRLASNYFRNKRRRNQQRTRQEPWLGTIPDPRSERRIDTVAQMDQAYKLLAAMKPEDRELLEMRHGIGREELTAEEIARGCGVKSQAINKRLRRIYRQARQERSHDPR